MKYIIRMDPVRPGDAPAMEQWLEDCAARGLSLVKLGSGFCLFKRGEEKKVRFRLAPSGRRKNSDGELRRQLYEQAGWQYAGGWDVFYVFRTEDPQAPEPYSDGESRAMALSDLDTALKQYHIRRAIAYGVLLALLLAVGASHSWIFLKLLLTIPTTVLIWAVLEALQGVERTRRLRALRRAAAERRAPAARKPAPVRNAALSVITLLALLGLVNSWRLERQELPVWEGHAPCIVELETTYYCTSHEGTFRRTAATLLAPVQTRTEEDGYSEFQPEETGDGKPQLPTVNGFYHPGLDTVTLRLTLPFLTRAAAMAEMEDLRIQNIQWQQREIQCPGTDFAVLWESGAHFQMLALGRGRRAVIYRYRGAEDLTDHLELLCRPLQ